MGFRAVSTMSEALTYRYDAVCHPDDLYHSAKWLMMEEQVGIARPFTVLSVPDSGGPAIAGSWGLVVDSSAFWPFMRIDTMLSTMLAERNVPISPAMAKTLAGLMPNAYLGALRGGTTRLPVRIDADEIDARKAIGDVIDGAEAMARKDGLRSIAFFYVPVEDALLREVLRDKGFGEFGPTMHVSVLQLPGATFADYITRFGKRRRDSIRWERRKIAAADVHIDTEALTPELSEEMLPLEAQLYHKYGHPSHPTAMARQLHESVTTQFPADAPVITARSPDGVLRGYAAFIKVGTTLYSRDTGYDYAWQGALPLYFEVLYYRAIELAMKLGANEINYSYGSDDTKLSRGCQLRPRVGYLKAFDHDLNGLLADLAYEPETGNMKAN
jgi:hypothetical protein